MKFQKRKVLGTPAHGRFLSKLIRLSKRQKFVVVVFFLTVAFLISGFFQGISHFLFSLGISFATVVSMYLILRDDLKHSFYYPLFILPFLYTFSFDVFLLLIPARLIALIISTGFFALGLYSLFLTQNIFAVSSIRTISLLRSARIVSFVITIIVLFFLTNIVFSVPMPFFLPPIIIGVVVFLLSFQSLWVYLLDKSYLRDIVWYSLPIAFAIFQLAFVLILWPVSASIYSIFLTGIFYMYSGLTHAWIEKRLFRGILWEYIWVGFLSVFILLFFSRWGI